MLEIEVQALDKNPHIGLVYADVDITDEDGKLLQDRNVTLLTGQRKKANKFDYWLPLDSIPFCFSQAA